MKYINKIIENVRAAVPTDQKLSAKEMFDIIEHSTNGSDDDFYCLAHAAFEVGFSKGRDYQKNLMNSLPFEDEPDPHETELSMFCRELLPLIKNHIGTCSL